jgi:hypothetical protein
MTGVWQSGGSHVPRPSPGGRTRLAPFAGMATLRRRGSGTPSTAATGAAHPSSLSSRASDAAGGVVSPGNQQAMTRPTALRHDPPADRACQPSALKGRKMIAQGKSRAPRGAPPWVRSAPLSPPLQTWLCITHISRGEPLGFHGLSFSLLSRRPPFCLCIGTGSEICDLRFEMAPVPRSLPGARQHWAHDGGPSGRGRS